MQLRRLLAVLRPFVQETHSMTARPPTAGTRSRGWAKWYALAIFIALGIFVGRYVVEQQRLAKVRAAEKANEALLARFEQMVEPLSEKDATLSARFADFTRQTGIRVEISSSSPTTFFERALRQPLRLDLPPLPAHVWLQTVCGLHHVSWKIDSDGSALLQADLQTDISNEPRYWRNYPLLESTRLSPEQLSHLLATFVTPEEWESMDGYSSQQITPTGVTTFQSHRGHLQTRSFLANLQACCQQAEQPVNSQLALAATMPAPIWFDGNASQWQQCQAVLDRPITLRAVDMPVAEFVDKLSELARFPVVMHPRELGIGTSFDKRITCDLQQVALRNALQPLLHLADFAWSPRANGRLLVICDPDQGPAFRAETLLAYHVADLTDIDSPHTNTQLIELLQNFEPDSWTDVGGRGDIEELADGKLLLISQTLKNHRLIEELLTRLRQVRRGEVRHAICTPELPLPTISAAAESRLAEPLEIEFRGAVEAQWFPNVCQRGGIRLPSFAQGDLSEAAKLWCHLPARPLRENLELLFTARSFEMRHLEFVTLADDGQEFADEKLSVTDIFELRPWLNARHTTLSVAELLESVVEPNSWQSVGGPGLCAEFQDALIVQTHPRVMAKVRSFLAAFEDHLKAQKKTWRNRPLEGETLQQPLDLFGENDIDNASDLRMKQRQAALQEQLLERVTLQIVKRQRITAILDLARKYKLPIILDFVPLIYPRQDPFGDTLHPAESGPDEVTLDFDDQSLGEVLQQLIGDPAVQVWHTTRGFLSVGRPVTEVESEPEFWLYSIDDLLAPRGKLQPKQLIRTLEEGFATAFANGELDTRRTRQPDLHIEFRFGNLLQVYNDQEPGTRALIELMLRELRNGSRQPVPAQNRDNDYYEPYYPPLRFRPYVTGPIPVVG